MNGQAMAQWLVENKNGKEWKKYGKERVYINVYVGGMQVANYFYDIVTDRFFGCDSKTEKAIRAEYEKATETSTNNDIEKLQKELETRQSMLRTQMKSKYASQEVIEENKKRIQELEATIKAETATEETAEEVVEETKEAETTEETEAKTEIKETARKISNELQNKFQMKKKEAQKEEMEILKDLTSKIKNNLEKSEIKDIVTKRNLSQFQLLLLKYIYKELQKWTPREKWSGGEFGIRIIERRYDRVDFITDLVFNRNFEKLIKSIKNFIKKGGD